MNSSGKYCWLIHRKLKLKLATLLILTQKTTQSLPEETVTRWWIKKVFLSVEQLFLTWRKCQLDKRKWGIFYFFYFLLKQLQEKSHVTHYSFHVFLVKYFFSKNLDEFIENWKKKFVIRQHNNCFYVICTITLFWSVEKYIASWLLLECSIATTKNK